MDTTWIPSCWPASLPRWKSLGEQSRWTSTRTFQKLSPRFVRHWYSKSYPLEKWPALRAALATSSSASQSIKTSEAPTLPHKRLNTLMSHIGTAQVTFVRPQTRIFLPPLARCSITFTEGRGICVPSPRGPASHYSSSLTIRPVTLSLTQNLLLDLLGVVVL